MKNIWVFWREKKLGEWQCQQQTKSLLVLCDLKEGKDDENNEPGTQ